MMTTIADEGSVARAVGKSPTAYRTIAEVADELELPQHVLRFWESKFQQVRPLKRGGGRRYYRPEDVALLRRIRDLLYDEHYTIRGAQKLLRQHKPPRPLPSAPPPITEPRTRVASFESEAPLKASLDPGVRRVLESVIAELAVVKRLLSAGRSD